VAAVTAYTLAAMGGARETELSSVPSGAEEVVEGEAVEEPVTGEAAPVAQPSRLPQPSRGVELEAWREEMRTAAIAAAGGIVAGAATVAALRAVRSGAGARRQRPRRLGRRRQEPPNVIASRSFLVDVHLLGNR
jgi:hypothetical protein